MSIFRKTRNYKPRRRSYKSKVKKAIRTVKRKSMVNLIRSVINKEAQTKYCNTVSSQINFNSSIDSTAEMYPVFPQLAIGYQNDKSRVGNEIKPMKLQIKGLVKITNTATMPQPKYAYIYFLEDKHQKDATLGASSSFFLSDGGTPTQFTGTWATASLPVDTNHFRLIRRIRVRLTQNFASGSTQNGVVDPNGTIYREFTFNIPMKRRILKYDNSGTSVLPNNLNYVWCCGYQNYDGAVDIALQNVTVQINSLMWFKDF